MSIVFQNFPTPSSNLTRISGWLWRSCRGSCNKTARSSRRSKGRGVEVRFRLEGSHSKSSLARSCRKYFKKEQHVLVITAAKAKHEKSRAGIDLLFKDLLQMTCPPLFQDYKLMLPCKPSLMRPFQAYPQKKKHIRLDKTQKISFSPLIWPSSYIIILSSSLISFCLTKSTTLISWRWTIFHAPLPNDKFCQGSTPNSEGHVQPSPLVPFLICLVVVGHRRHDQKIKSKSPWSSNGSM